MNLSKHLLFLGTAALCASSLYATVSIPTLTPSVSSPQPLGTQVTWTATATDSNTGPLTFQYSVARGAGTYRIVRDFYLGTLNSGTWTGPAFVWQNNQEGTFQIKVIAKDFQSGETATASAVFTLTPRSTGGSFVVSATQNPLVALGSAPPCPTGSSILLTIQKTGGRLVSRTKLQACNPQLTSNILAAGMYPSTSYSINYEVVTGSTVTPGPTPVTFTTGPLPTSITFPTSTVITPSGPQDEAGQYTVLHSYIAYVLAATDLAGNINWYYAAPEANPTSLLTRPLPGGIILTMQAGNYWNPNRWVSA